MKVITVGDKLCKAVNDLNRAQAQREAGFKAIVRADAKIEAAKRTIKRLERRLDRFTAETKAKTRQLKQFTAAVETFKENIPPAESSLDIPEALRRPLPAKTEPAKAEPAKAEPPWWKDYVPDRKWHTLNPADEVAKAEIQAALNTQKQAKTKARIEKLKATKSGARRSMPLSGKAAADYIKQG